MNQVLMHKISKLAKEGGARGIPFRKLCESLAPNRGSMGELRNTIAYMVKKGELIERGYSICHTSKLVLRTAMVVKLNKTFGFVKFTDDETDAFVPGKFFMGAMPGDKVLTVPLPSRGSSPEAEVVRILKEGDGKFTGSVVSANGLFFIRPDSMIGFDLPIPTARLCGAEPGDKVLCRIFKRGETHREHRAEVIANYGKSEKAANCADALLDLHKVSLEFPDLVKAEAEYIMERGITEEDKAERLDLRGRIIFTIDSADTKDIDDAISLSRTENGYSLGVHIADVSHYVKPSTALDDEAFDRGTSIYFADRVVPMLPTELSNGICSLNPNEDRLAFSCLMELDRQGKLTEYTFKKTLIRSRVKGVYKEINSILDGSASDEIKAKYSETTDSILLMEELADILTANKIARGAPEIETTESYIVLDAEHSPVDIVPRTRGKSEVMIEEFMLTANEAAAAFARERDLPFVYRVHEPPSAEKTENLRETLTALGLPTANIGESVTAPALSGILKAAKGKPYYPIVNTIVLRSMSKAKYFEAPLGHFGLVLDDYAQFTSPIRRYPDLSIHRILSDAAEGMEIAKIQKKYTRFAVRSSRHSTEAELNAMQLERKCDDIYKAEYMLSHVGEEFDGIVSGIATHGLYVELANTVEGLIRTVDLPGGGDYAAEGIVALRSSVGGYVFRIGDSVRVKCTAADVPTGNVDFVLAEE